MTARRSNPLLRSLFRAPVPLYRRRCGWLFGHRLLLLIHVGRRTGLRRYTVLEALEYRKDGPEILVMSAFGPGADWLRNIETAPMAEVISGSDHFAAGHRILDAEEAIAAIAGYERRNRSMAPLIRLVLSRRLGWRYRGCDADRPRLAAAFPMVAFRPRSQRS
jgi:deazaflavin-dependent oxidoreductase (nitroreductase family)